MARWLTRHLQTPFVGLVLVGMLAVLGLSREFSPGAKLFPTFVAGAGVVLGILELRRQIRSRGTREAQDFSDLGGDEHTPATYGRGLRYVGWMAAFMGLFLLIGALPATLVFVAAFLRLQHGESWRLSLLLAGILMLVLATLGHFLRLRWPDPWLF
jgi:hypothetical protein